MKIRNLVKLGILCLSTATLVSSAQDLDGVLDQQRQIIQNNFGGRPPSIFMIHAYEEGEADPRNTEMFNALQQAGFQVFYSGHPGGGMAAHGNNNINAFAQLINEVDFTLVMVTPALSDNVVSNPGAIVNQELNILREERARLDNGNDPFFQYLNGDLHIAHIARPFIPISVDVGFPQFQHTFPDNLFEGAVIQNFFDPLEGLRADRMQGLFDHINGISLGARNQLVNIHNHGGAQNDQLTRVLDVARINTRYLRRYIRDFSYENLNNGAGNLVDLIRNDGLTGIRTLTLHGTMGGGVRNALRREHLPILARLDLHGHNLTEERQNQLIAQLPGVNINF